MATGNAHEKVEKSVGLLVVLILAAISVGGLVQIVPLWYMRTLTEPVAGLTPPGPLELAGRDVYVRESCMACHSQLVRPFRAETERYGHYSVAGEFVYDRPFQFGSRRTGPDLARVGGRYSDEWHREHLLAPRDLVSESIMPAYPWLADAALDAGLVQKKMRALAALGHPYTEEQIAAAPEALAERTEMDALIAYLQSLGTAIQARR
ncbi:MAG: cytochrome-c oxidase, cbb3-type subunit II [Thermoanaerobaculia bacterium]|nr:MAG: cytochrome-c oxidase, cbb3-type subunit II [Thermoanaerobaculia bacterium]